MAVDWTDAPEFGRESTLTSAIGSLHMIRERYEDNGIVIVETGTTRGALGGGIEGDGWATVVFGWYCSKYGGKVYTVDISEEAIEECKIVTHDYKDVIDYVVSDSVEFLESFDKKIDFLYLDSADDPQVIMNELRTAYDKLNTAALVVIDDTHKSMTIGKGVLACQYLLQEGWRLLMDKEGQVIFTNVPITLKPASFVPSDFSMDLYEFVQYKAEKEVKLRIEDYDDHAKVWNDLFLSWLPKKEKVPEIGGMCKALDLGTNTGYNARILEKKYGYAVGIDINEALLSYSHLNHDKCYKMDATELKFEDESFSVVTAKDIIEHTLDPDAVINESYRVLVDGGYFLCIIPLDGEVVGIDEIVLHPVYSFGNASHTWKATADGVLRRIYEAGFTEVTHRVVSNLELFGEERPFGDKVIAVRAKKVKGIIKVPYRWLIESAYWGAFLTFVCTGGCKYCIQTHSKDEFIRAKKYYEKNKLSADEWINFYNRLQHSKVQHLSLIGGEPLLYDGIFQIVNSLKGYYSTITTNLCASAFDGLESEIPDKVKKDMRINTSFHPKIISVDEFCNKIHKLRDWGYQVDQIAMVDHPTSNFRYYYNEFLQRGLNLAPQTYLGKNEGFLLPDPESDLALDHREHGIANFDLYKEGFSCEQKQDVLCSINRFLVSPNGNIYRCHYHLYSNRSPMGNITDGELLETKDYELCADFGYCNPCDFPHARFKSIVIDFPNILLAILRNEDLTKHILESIASSGSGLETFTSEVVSELYCTRDPYWEIYNNEGLKQKINDFINEGEPNDIANALLLAQFEANIYRCLPHNVNVYRLLDGTALGKYIDALGAIVLKIYELLQVEGSKLYKVDLCKAYASDIAMLVTSLGMSRYKDGRVHIMMKEPN